LKLSFFLFFFFFFFFIYSGRLQGNIDLAKQAQILQACEAPSDPQTNNKLEELGRRSPLDLEKATLNSKNN
jgi:hypothetical protein